MATRSNAPPKPHLGFGTRIRKSPFFESTLAWGCKGIYNIQSHVFSSLLQYSRGRFLEPS